jgi:TolA-binding protein
VRAPAVKGKVHPGPDKAELQRLPKAELIAMILKQREDTRIQLEEKDKRITELSEKLAKLQGEIDEQKTEQKVKDINKQVNQPTSKKPEWDKDGNPKPTTKGAKKKANKKKKRKKRTGCGNPGKSGLKPEETNFTPLAAAMTSATGKARRTAGVSWKTSPRPRRTLLYSKR